jgi:hypothetical protein
MKERGLCSEKKTTTAVAPDTNLGLVITEIGYEK